ncbi:uncharacterized protein EV422DRAFT_150370 [Fimicolochytrium jonesii]|uniref:uncharacterized protein n=1 Tax=Fimicolochytrium jonesii TaxID=1396493 RepID=UPI0022FE10C9|nr:uncharacterized protein EV422DRAFT_150370 [Fimicolochytrium jonesii]KAI8826027.1 hypothetical protein EV422DRAFT_150370 [Fimicolochytrium jonesii]
MDKLKAAFSQAFTTSFNPKSPTGLSSDSIDSALQSHMVSKLRPSRPPLDKRKFSSLAVENVIERVKRVFEEKGRSELADLFELCYPNTLDTTVVHTEVEIEGGNRQGDDTFVITGDIPAMWLRDSTNQVNPYLPLAKTQAPIRHMLLGLIARQTRCLNTDIYANAFKKSRHQWGEWDKDLVHPKLSSLAWEGKYELDSLCAFLKLSNRYYEVTRDTSFADGEWTTAVDAVLGVMRVQQRGTLEELEEPAYSFVRVGNVPIDTLMLDGRGPPAKRCGLIKSPFRPSDDASTYPFLVPANAMAVVELQKLSALLTSLEADSATPSSSQTRSYKSLAEEANSLASEVKEAIYKHALVEHPRFGKVFAYEVDGFGNALFMDDANIPSLLSLPYLGFLPATDPDYLRTRTFILSDSNPYYFSGSAGKGVGGPHVGLGWIWPMGIVVQALTTATEDLGSDPEVQACVEILVKSTAGTGFMHESFFMDDVQKFTRPWFAWANSLFAELLLKLAGSDGTVDEPGSINDAPTDAHLAAAHTAVGAATTCSTAGEEDAKIVGEDVPEAGVDAPSV